MQTPSRTTALILAHVAVLGACKSTPSAAPEQSVPPTPAAHEAPTAATDPVPTAPTAEPTAPTADPPAPTASAAPAASAPPVATAVTAEYVCTTDADCRGGVCQRTRAKDGSLAKSGHCKGLIQPTRGRALVVEGDTHVAEVGAAAGDLDGSLARVDALLREVAEEHASIAAFARTTCELMALGAPLSLLRETARALADEVEHTARTLAWVSRITGKSVTVSALPAAAAPLRHGPTEVEALFRDVFRGGAVGETLAAALADDESLRGAEEMRAHYRALADDEARHAALAFTTLRWLLETYPSLSTVRDEEIASFLAAASPEHHTLVAPLFATLGHLGSTPGAPGQPS